MPNKISKEAVLAVIKDMAAGASLRSLLARESIHAQVFFDAVFSDPQLTEQYSRARQARTELEVDGLIEIADTEPDPNKARVRIDTRKWIASKMNPNQYGDRIDVNVNQTIDIGGALKEARARALPPSTDVVDIIEIKALNTTGLEPVADKPVPENESDDIFS